ncbi:hypothetical protein [Alkalibacillus haloalkaliphilus]|uniref:hypothetical protein n=1 Tax=Alkalibacillus haloalkaliphilus TaxID=94136 RepID=UPI002936CC6F|nr:hypothetical protein [Alkalibacillus haloalkaliphilus]MDV2580834.1 hypothetical protein [Alkalibacillus haloalkaliphilus]
MKLKIITLLTFTVLLSGCLYPNERMQENQATNDEQLAAVQQAVEEFSERNNGILPIHTRDQDTPLFIKYPVNFNSLKEENILGETPGNAYEQGGYYSYVIVHPREEPTVQVSDVRVTQTLRSINYEINIYRNNAGNPPYGESLGNGLFTINQDRVNLRDEPNVTSPYTGQELDVVMTTQGEAVVDYRPDVYQLMESEGIDEYDGDLRYLLIEHYPIVPAFSPEMYLEDGQIVLKEGIVTE